jgi:acetylornithine deacetylase/succinyl-diaminopimelate desuccinylase-like protein
LKPLVIGADPFNVEGIWGNMAPDPGNALVRLLARLIDDDGRLTVGQCDVDPTWKESTKALPLDDEVVRVGAHLRPDVAPLPHRGRSPAEWLWRQPAITVLSTTLPSPDRHKNAIRQSAAATLSIRLAPGQTREQMRSAIEKTLTVNPPAGVAVTLNDRPGGSESWLYTPRGAAFEAADRAYERAWGHPLVQIGIGGSIPFVALFGRRFARLPLILNGVMDPETGAHGPDESLHLGVFEKALLANVYLFDELARIDKGSL